MTKPHPLHTSDSETAGRRIGPVMSDVHVHGDVATRPRPCGAAFGLRMVARHAFTAAGPTLWPLGCGGTRLEAQSDDEA